MDGQLQSLANLEGGGRPLYDAIIIATNFSVNSATAGNRRVVLLFTDGRDTSSNSSLEDVIDFATEHGVEIHPVTLSGDVDIAALSQIAARTGGSLSSADDARRLISHYGGMGPLLAGSGQFYRTTWSMSLVGGEGLSRLLDKYLSVHRYPRRYRVRSIPPGFRLIDHAAEDTCLPVAPAASRAWMLAWLFDTLVATSKGVKSTGRRCVHVRSGIHQQCDHIATIGNRCRKMEGSRTDITPGVRIGTRVQQRLGGIQGIAGEGCVV